MACPDCKGTGKYIGLFHTEDCKTCRKNENFVVAYGGALKTFDANAIPVLLSKGHTELTPHLAFNARCVTLQSKNKNTMSPTLDNLRTVGPWSHVGSYSDHDGNYTYCQFESKCGNYQLIIYHTYLSKDEILRLLNASDTEIKLFGCIELKYLSPNGSLIQPTMPSLSDIKAAGPWHLARSQSDWQHCFYVFNNQKITSQLTCSNSPQTTDEILEIINAST